MMHHLKTYCNPLHMEHTLPLLLENSCYWALFFNGFLFGHQMILGTLEILPTISLIKRLTCLYH